MLVYCLATQYIHNTGLPPSCLIHVLYPLVLQEKHVSVCEILLVQLDLVIIILYSSNQLLPCIHRGSPYPITVQCGPCLPPLLFVSNSAPLRQSSAVLPQEFCTRCQKHCVRSGLSPPLPPTNSSFSGRFCWISWSLLPQYQLWHLRSLHVQSHRLYRPLSQANCGCSSHSM